MLFTGTNYADEQWHNLQALTPPSLTPPRHHLLCLLNANFTIRLNCLDMLVAVERLD